MEGGDRHRTLYLKAGLAIAFLVLACQLFLSGPGTYP